MLLSVIIATYNEENRIVTTVNRISSFLDAQGYEYEVIVVDDGSNDKTVNALSSYPRTMKRPIQIIAERGNHGKGYAVRMGILSSEGDYVLYCDADLSAPIEEVQKLLPFFQRGYDVTIGSRAMKDSQILVHQSWYREGMGKIFNFFVQMLIMKGLKDTQCGFKIFKSAIAKKIFAKTKINRFAFDVEALFLAKKLGYRIKDVPIIWINAPCSKVHIIKDSLIMLIDIFRILIYRALGFYNV